MIREQVRSVYPNAKCRMDKYHKWVVSCTTQDGKRVRLGWCTYSEMIAWQNAYDNLKKQNLL